MNKAEIMRMANKLIEALSFCDDEEFVEEVIMAVSSECYFDIDQED